MHKKRVLCFFNVGTGEYEGRLVSNEELPIQDQLERWCGGDGKEFFAFDESALPKEVDLESEGVLEYLMDAVKEYYKFECSKFKHKTIIRNGHM